MCQHDPHHALFDDGVRHFLHSLLLLRAGSGSGFGSKVLAHVMLWLKFFGHRLPAQTGSGWFGLGHSKTMALGPNFRSGFGPNQPYFCSLRSIIEFCTQQKVPADNSKLLLKLLLVKADNSRQEGGIGEGGYYFTLM